VAGDNPVSRYCPVSSVLAAYRVPLAVSTAATATFGTTPPDASVIVPVMLPEAPTPCASAAGFTNSRHADNRKAPVTNVDFIGPPRHPRQGQVFVSRPLRLIG